MVTEAEMRTKGISAACIEMTLVQACRTLIDILALTAIPWKTNHTLAHERATCVCTSRIGMAIVKSWCAFIRICSEEKHTKYIWILLESKTSCYFTVFTDILSLARSFASTREIVVFFFQQILAVHSVSEQKLGPSFRLILMHPSFLKRLFVLEAWLDGSVSCNKKKIWKKWRTQFSWCTPLV